MTRKERRHHIMRFAKTCRYVPLLISSLRVAWNDRHGSISPRDLLEEVGKVNVVTEHLIGSIWIRWDTAEQMETARKRWHQYVADNGIGDLPRQHPPSCT